MSRVAITKRGLVSEEWDSESQQYILEPCENWLTRLRSVCTIEDGVTLLDIFNAVDALPELKSFIAEYSWCWSIGEFHAQARLPYKPPEGEVEDIQYLSVSKHYEIDEDDIQECLHFGGVGKKTPSWSVSHVEMYKIAHLPVRVSPRADIMTGHQKSGSRECFMTLLEVLDTIYDDISFHGGPKENAEFVDMLHERIEEVKYGRATLVPWEPEKIQ